MQAPQTTPPQVEARPPEPEQVFALLCFGGLVLILGFITLVAAAAALLVGGAWLAWHSAQRPWPIPQLTVEPWSSDADRVRLTEEGPELEIRRVWVSCPWSAVTEARPLVASRDPNAPHLWQMAVDGWRVVLRDDTSDPHSFCWAFRAAYEDNLAERHRYAFVPTAALSQAAPVAEDEDRGLSKADA